MRQLYSTLILILFIFPTFAIAQEGVILNGIIYDAQTNTPVPFAHIIVDEQRNVITSDAVGAYNFTGQLNQLVTIQSIGYSSKTLRLEQNHQIYLEPQTTQLQEVVITAQEQEISRLNRPSKEITIAELQELPQFMGEVDIIKHVQMQSGVSQVSEGSSSFFVRGGSSDQNLILLDGVPVYEVSHLFGIISVFNPDILASSDLYNGGIPAQFGSRLSSVLDAKTTRPDLERFTMKGGIGVLASRLNVSTPIVKEKLAISMSARRSYIDLFQKKLGPPEAQKNFIHFSDLYGQILYQPTDKDKIHFSAYYGHDQFTSQENFAFSWGNQLMQISWEHYFNSGIFLRSGINHSRFGFQMDNPSDPQLAFLWENEVSKTQLFTELNWEFSKSSLQVGLQANYSHYKPGEVSPISTFSQFLEFNLPQYHNTEYSPYIQQQFQWNNVQLAMGVRASIFQHIGPWEDPKSNQSTAIKDLVPVHNYYHLSPRVNLHYQPANELDLFFTYQKMYQPVHQITNGTIPLPFNTWIPSFKDLAPQTATQITIGATQKISQGYELKVESFFKLMRNVSEFSDNAQTIGNPELIYDVRQGNGYGRGIETSLSKTSGKLKGQINYTYSRSSRTIEGVNQGKQYRTSFDRPHILNLWMSYKFNPQWSVGATFQYASGRPTTLPSGKYKFRGYSLNFFPQRNNYTMPDFHRLDLSATYRPKSNDKHRFKSSFSLSIYNTYNRKNLFTIFASQDRSGQPVFKQIYLFPVMPTLTYNFEF